MKMRALAFVSVLLLTGCNDLSTAAPSGSISSQIPGKVSLRTEQALTVAHIAFNGISQEILLATKAGVLRGDTAAQVQVWYDRAGDALQVADKAHAALNEQGVLSALLKANEAISMAKNLVGA